MKFHNVVIALLATCLAGCANHDRPDDDTPFTLSAPIAVLTAHTPVSSRAMTGDPGEDDELPPPGNLYVFAWIETPSGKYELYHTARTGLTAADWTYRVGGDGEDRTSRYDLNRALQLKFQALARAAADGTPVGRVYAVATSRALTDSQLQSILGTTYQAALTSGESVRFASSPDASLRQATASLAGWTITELRDLYSTPAGLSGGQVKASAANPGHATCEPLRLYHCAAKFDFLWEVAPALQPTTTVRQIEVTGLPTICRLFQPTANPADGPTSVTQATDEGSQWLGRTYFYALQPPSAKLTYDVRFTGRPDKTGIAFTPANPDPTFTGWYRIIATVND